MSAAPSRARQGVRHGPHVAGVQRPQSSVGSHGTPEAAATAASEATRVKHLRAASALAGRPGRRCVPSPRRGSRRWRVADVGRGRRIHRSLSLSRRQVVAGCRTFAEREPGPSDGGLRPGRANRGSVSPPGRRRGAGSRPTSAGLSLGSTRARLASVAPAASPRCHRRLRSGAQAAAPGRRSMRSIAPHRPSRRRCPRSQHPGTRASDVVGLERLPKCHRA